MENCQFKVARLQSEFCTRIVLSYDFLQKCSEIVPDILEPLFLWVPKDSAIKSLQISPPKFPPKKKLKFTNESFAGTQREQFYHQKFHNISHGDVHAWFHAKISPQQLCKPCFGPISGGMAEKWIFVGSSNWQAILVRNSCVFPGYHRPFNGPFRGAVFRHGGSARKQPIKQPTEMPTSTMALMGRFASLMGRIPTLMGRFTNFVLRGRFTL